MQCLNPALKQWATLGSSLAGLRKVARLEMGDVLLTTGIRFVQSSVLFGVMAGDVAPGQFDGEGFPAQSGKLGGFAQGEKFPLIKSSGQFAAQPRRHFPLGQAKALGNRIGNFYDD